MKNILIKVCFVCFLSHIHYKVWYFHADAPPNFLLLGKFQDFLLRQTSFSTVGEPEVLIPGGREGEGVVVTDEYLLPLLDVPHRHDGHNPAKPGVLELLKGGVPQLEVVAGLVAEGGAVLVAGLVLRPDIQVYRLVQG